MLDLATTIVPLLCILFFVWMFTEQFSGALEGLGYTVPVSVRIIIITLIMVAFATSYLLPGKPVHALIFR